MTHPRQILSGHFYMVTRRTTQRMFLLRPDEKVNAAFEYCFADAVRRSGVEVIAWVAMSNHYHAILYDPKGKLPVFTEHFHKMLTNCLNDYHSRRENLFSSDPTCVTRLVTLEDVFDKVVYVLSNPAAAHLVDDIIHWPGSSSWFRMGAKEPETTTRPRSYFRADGVMPAVNGLQVVVPRGLIGETAEQWIERVRKTVGLNQHELSQKRAAKGRRVLGRREVRKTSPFRSPSSEHKQSKLRPELACKDATRMKKERAALRGFRTAHRRCRKELRKDTRLRFRKRKAETLEATHAEAPMIVFPAGTYRMRILLAVRCETYRAVA